MSEWTFAQSRPDQELALIHLYSVKNRQGIEFRITVKEFVTPRDPLMKFFALADKPINQHAVPVTPSGWGSSMLDALASCLRLIDQFPYGGD